jgi:hypothetical protein
MSRTAVLDACVPAHAVLQSNEDTVFAELDKLFAQ